MTSKYKRYLKSKAWLKIKLSLYKLRGKRCEDCGSIKSLHVHHLHYNNIFNEKLADLKILCKICHEKVHGINKGKKKAVKANYTLAEKLLFKKKKKRKSKKFKSCRFIDTNFRYR